MSLKKHVRPEEKIAKELRSQRAGIRDVQRPTGTEVNLTTEVAQQAGSDADAALVAAGQASDDALAAAQKADDTKFLAEGLYQVIPSTTEPTTSPTGALKQGDQWWKIGTGATDGKFIGVAVWDGTEWQDRQIVADSVLVPGSVGPVLIEDGAVTASKIAGDAIDGKTITGAIVRTAASGQRLQMDIDGLKAFDSSGAVRSTLSSDQGDIVVRQQHPLNPYSRFYSGDWVSDAATGIRAEVGSAATPEGHARTDLVSFIDDVGSGGVSSYLYLTAREAGESYARLDFEVNARTSFGEPYSSASIMASKVDRLTIGVGGIGADDGDIAIQTRVSHWGNVFLTKSELDDWYDVADGTRAWVSSENREYVRVGSGWVPWYDGAGDTDWATLPLPSGIVTHSSATPMWKIRNKKLIIKGAVTRTSGSFGTSYTIVVSPNSSLILPGATGWDAVRPAMSAGGVIPGRQNIQTDGSIQVAASTGTAPYFVLNAEYELD